ncbi:MAG: ABC transporter ATP-binding protein [Bacillota bacterium]|nr:ABC transporter ATP-binding protein [Bacillota bacterium]
MAEQTGEKRERAAAAVEAERLGKRYGQRTALAGVSFQIQKGETVKILGPNGAGKSTLLRLLARLTLPTEGQVRLLGRDGGERREIARLVGYAGHEPPLYRALTAQENLFFYGRMHGLSKRAVQERVAFLLELVGLQDKGGERVGRLSHGTVRRLGVALALLHDPPILLLDEPFGGLDPSSRDQLRRVLSRLPEKTILLSTHDFSEVGRGERVFFLSRGRLCWDGRANGDPRELACLYQEMVRNA